MQKCRILFIKKSSHIIILLYKKYFYSLFLNRLGNKSNIWKKN